MRLGVETLEHIQDDKFEQSFLPFTSMGDGVGVAVLPDLYCFTNRIVNICVVGNPDESRDFFLIDAGMPKNKVEIRSMIEDRFGEGAIPKAIILTHGHFDHVGSLVELLEDWDVPVYAHIDEIPYLTGSADYPKGDSTVDGGLVSELSPMFPNHGINLGEKVKTLPNDGSIPMMEGWRWLHTPGHTPGHIALFRDHDRTLIAGDAFVTVKQESLYKVFTQELEISGPPKYYTTDWDAAYRSVKKLAELLPDTAITGHGKPLQGSQLKEALTTLIKRFDEIAKPKNGRFVN